MALTGVASTQVDGEVISSIGKGLLCLVGLATSDADSAEAAQYMCVSTLPADVVCSPGLLLLFLMAACLHVVGRSAVAARF